MAVCFGRFAVIVKMKVYINIKLFNFEL